MANNASNYMQAAMLKHVLGKTSFTMPTAYVALLNGAPANSQTGSTIPETAYTGYARVVTAGADWAAPSGGSPENESNANQINFPACTAGSGNPIYGFAICDAATTGNLLISSLIGTPASVTSITNSGATATVTQTAHGYVTGDWVLIQGASLAANNGSFQVTNTGANTYTYTMGSSPGSNPTGTITALKATLVVGSGVTPNFPAGQLTLSAD